MHSMGRPEGSLVGSQTREVLSVLELWCPLTENDEGENHDHDRNQGHHHQEHKNLVASGERLAIHLTDGEPNLHDLHDLKSL